MRSSNIGEFILPRAQMADTALRKLDRDFGLSAMLKSIEGVRAGGSRSSSRPPISKIEENLSSSTKGVILESAGLWDRRGFMGGQVMAGFLSQWKEVRGWGEASTTPYFDSYVDAGIFLWKVWERFIEPVAGVEGEVTYIFADWNDNKLRAKGAAQVGLAPIWSVSYRDLSKLADEVFPARSDEWLSIFMGLVLRARPDSPTGARIAERGALFPGLELIYQVQCEIADALEPLVAELPCEIFDMFLSLAGLGSSNNFSLDLLDRRYVGDDTFAQAALAVANCLLV